MNIKAIRTYQAISFDKRSETFFSTLTAGNKKIVELKLLEKLMCVEIRSETDHVLVPFTNISAIHIVTQQALDEVAATEAEKLGRKSGISIQDIKRPR